jgi:hypothetical protein
MQCEAYMITIVQFLEPDILISILFFESIGVNVVSREPAGDSTIR